MRTTHTLLLASVLAVPACTGDVTGDGYVPPSGPSTVGGEDNTFDHDNNSDVDPFELLDRLQQEGPPRVSARMHGCNRLPYRTIGNVLRSRGADPANGAPLSAGDLYQNGRSALGTANYAARIRENLDVTTSGASRLFDIFVQAAPEIIANLPNQAACQRGGVGVQLFDANNQCVADGITCLLGVPAQPGHIELCNYAITHAADVESGKQLAVATLLAAAQTCE